MFSIVQSRIFVPIFLCCFVLFCLPQTGAAQEAQGAAKGDIVAYVYGSDYTTPVEGAVLKLKNIDTGSAYESLASDDQGMVVVEGVDRGLYTVGITTAEGDYNVGNLIGVKPRRTAKISIALKPGEQAEGEVKTITKHCPKGQWYVPEIQGQCDENYKWNPGTERCECKRRNPLAFFLTPLGFGSVVAASAGVVAFSLSGDKEPSASSFK